MKKPNPKPEIATVPAFRAWLADALEITGMAASRVSLGIDAGINLVSAFQRDAGRDITLGHAGEIERFLRNEAADRQLQIPSIAQSAKSAGVCDV